MITVNLFDALFPQSSCSVAFQTSESIRYVRGLPEWDGITMFTDHYFDSDLVDRVHSRYKVGWLREPQCLHPDTYDHALENAHKFDFILTYYEPFLSMPVFKFCPYGGVWVDREMWGIYPKTKLCSMLVGAKKSTSGHLIRHEIYNQNKDNPAIDWYGIYGTPTDYSAETKRMVLQNYCFTIISETCRENNLFTEILLDCFAVGTVPIFWGAPNIGQYFDHEGIIPYQEAKDIQRILPTLSASLYEKMMPSVFSNNELVREYAVTEDWIYKNVFQAKGMV